MPSKVFVTHTYNFLPLLYSPIDRRHMVQIQSVKEHKMRNLKLNFSGKLVTYNINLSM